MITILMLVIGLALLVISSKKAVDESVKLAHILKISPIIIGLILVAFGTSLPEMATSVVSSMAGHGDINVGDSFGSAMAQITLILGLAVFIGGTIRAKRKNILILGGCAIVATIAGVLVTENGAISQGDAFLLLVVYAALIYISHKYISIKHSPPKHPKHVLYHLGLAIIGLMGVMIGAHLTINAVIELSSVFGLPEFIISFFAVGLGTSLPELAVDTMAAKRKQYGLIIGDLLGSNMIDMTLGLGLGPLIAPHILTSALISIGGWYVVFVSLITVGLFAWRQKLDRKAGIVLILLYLLSYVIV